MTVKHFNHCLLHGISLRGLGVKANAKTAFITTFARTTPLMNGHLGTTLTFFTYGAPGLDSGLMV